MICSLLAARVGECDGGAGEPRGANGEQDQETDEGRREEGQAVRLNLPLFSHLQATMMPFTVPCSHRTIGSS